ncbi:hypothetical protein C8R43DRAFT_987214 [Mycena crocata]|nr:hypothetical protein C8R43DRAFT_987214 [Mycena crocata]
MTLLKIFCIIATTLGLHVASTSPNPPLHSTERTISHSRMELVLSSLSLREAQRILYWFAGAAETAIVVAQLEPGSIPGQFVLSTLVLGGRLPSVCLTPRLVLGSVLIASGALLRLCCYRALGRYFTFELGIARGHQLVTTGPYRYARHPAYFGALLSYLGLLCYYGSPGSWLVECVVKGSIFGAVFCAAYAGVMSLIVAGLLARISREDEALEREFGIEWDMWAARVPYVLIPGIY